MKYFSTITLIKKRDRLKEELRQSHRFVPPGHFYSPIPSVDEIKQNEENIFMIPDTIPGVELNEKKQVSMFNEFIKYYGELPFKSTKTEGLRYFFENDAFSYSDAIILYSMIRHAKPRNIIEIGSGYSSCVILDTNEHFFDNSIKCTFIEPFPELFISLIKEDDKKDINIFSKKIQDINISEFLSLSAGDIILIDSSHVSKVNSDVNHIFFNILPKINSGVYVHLHDIFYPFEYPKEWLYEGRAWSESYILHAFLQYNSSFEIIFFNSFMEHFYNERYIKEMSLCMKNKGGSIWLMKK